MGWVHAQDRLWQMTYQRLFSEGRLSEVYGETTVPIDASMRLLRIPERSKVIVNTLSEENRRILGGLCARDKCIHRSDVGEAIRVLVGRDESRAFRSC